MSRVSPASKDADGESATERGIEAVRAELPVALALALPAPGKGIPAPAPLGPIVLYVDRMMQGVSWPGGLAQHSEQESQVAVSARMIWASWNGMR